MKKIILIIISVIFTVSCATNIADIRSNPKKFANQVVNVNGIVKNKVNIPFTDFTFFELEDKTSSIIVFTLSDYVKGDKINIKAKVIAYDSTNQVESSIKISKSISTLLIEKASVSKEKAEKTGETIGKFLVTVLNKMEATYLLVETTEK
jgi:hypothetical protein